jgi:hypothetical protein
MTPVDTSAEAVERVTREDEAIIESALRYDDNEMQGAFQEGYVRAMVIADRRWAKERADLESLLAARNVQNAAAFTASDGYQKRCEQGDALLRDSLAALTFVHMEMLDGQEGVTSQLLEQIRAHLAGEDMGRGL